jgi:predicted dehydrogenase
MAARLAAGPPTAIPATHFQLGFVLLWHGDLDEAETEMETGLHTAEQMGDLNLQARCLTYLAILQRRRGALNAARRFAERSLAVAARVGMHEYEGLAKANLAWLAWRDNDFSAAEALGAEAMKAWMAACADIERTAAARLAAQHGNPPVFSSVEEMLAGSELDAVLVATPHCALHPVARAAVRAGKHVMVEKPVGIDAQQVRELEEAVKQAGVLCLAGYSFRSFPALKIVRELVDGGTVGEIQAVLGSIGLPPLSGGWPATPETGGGPLLFVGSHLVDEVLWLVGDDPTEVTADVRTRADTGADETAAFQIAFAHGVTAQCLVTQAADGFFNCLDIVGRAGRIGLRGAGFLNYTVEVISKRQPAYSQPTTLRPTWTGDARVAMHVPQLEEFARAIREGGSPAVTLAEARRVMVVLDAVFEAGRTGTVVCIE